MSALARLASAFAIVFFVMPAQAGIHVFLLRKKNGDPHPPRKGGSFN